MGLFSVLVVLGLILPGLNAQLNKPERHSLHYVYTSLSKPVSGPGIYEFTGMGILDDRKIDFYNSADKVKKPERKWMKEKLPREYWEKGTQSRKSKEQWFKVNLNILMERKRQNESDLHVLNWKHGCEIDKYPDGHIQYVKGVDLYSYDGEDFLSYDDATLSWIAPVPEAVQTKHKWDGVPILNHYTKGYLEKECVEWLTKFLTYADEELMDMSPPELYLYSKQSKSSDGMQTMTCMATGFIPATISMVILRGESTVAKISRDKVLPNGDGSHQAKLKIEVYAADKNEYSCVINHKALKEAVVKTWQLDGLDTDGVPMNIILGGAFGGLLGLVLLISLVVGLVKSVECKKAEKTTDMKGTPEECKQLRKDSDGSQDSGLDSAEETIDMKATPAECEELKKDSDGSQDSGLDRVEETTDMKATPVVCQELKDSDGSQDSGLDKASVTTETGNRSSADPITVMVK